MNRVAALGLVGLLGATPILAQNQQMQNRQSFQQNEPDREFLDLSRDITLNENRTDGKSQALVDRIVKLASRYNIHFNSDVWLLSMGDNFVVGEYATFGKNKKKDVIFGQNYAVEVMEKYYTERHATKKENGDYIITQGRKFSAGEALPLYVQGGTFDEIYNKLGLLETTKDRLGEHENSIREFIQGELKGIGYKLVREISSNIKQDEKSVAFNFDRFEEFDTRVGGKRIIITAVGKGYLAPTIVLSIGHEGDISPWIKLYSGEEKRVNDFRLDKLFPIR